MRFHDPPLDIISGSPLRFFHSAIQTSRHPPRSKNPSSRGLPCGLVQIPFTIKVRIGTPSHVFLISPTTSVLAFATHVVAAGVGGERCCSTGSLRWVKSGGSEANSFGKLLEGSRRWSLFSLEETSRCEHWEGAGRHVCGSVSFIWTQEGAKTRQKWWISGKLKF